MSSLERDIKLTMKVANMRLSRYMTDGDVLVVATDESAVTACGAGETEKVTKKQFLNILLALSRMADSSEENRKNYIAAAETYKLEMNLRRGAADA